MYIESNPCGVPRFQTETVKIQNCFGCAYNSIMACKLEKKKLVNRNARFTNSYSSNYCKVIIIIIILIIITINQIRESTAD